MKKIHNFKVKMIRDDKSIQFRQRVICFKFNYCESEIFLIIAMANLEYLSCIATDMPSLGGEAMSKFGRPAKYGARKQRTERICADKQYPENKKC